MHLLLRILHPLHPPAGKIRLSGSCIADYLIVAPTEWNFHPAGAFRAELVGLRAADAGAVKRRVCLLALALDPCVFYNVRVWPVADERTAENAK
jgi:hypothetical protein